ncbi:MAG: hypothetical protein Kow0042_17700 [Calditrichia bacterium]
MISIKIKAIFLIVLACAGFNSLPAMARKPNDIPLKKLLASPDTVTIQGQRFRLETYLWRNFMPNSPPEGKPLRATLQVIPLDYVEVKGGIDADRVWVVSDGKILTAQLAPVGNPPSSGRIKKIEKMAVGGPKWGPGITVSVVVRLLDKDGNVYFLKATEQPIYRTD